MLIQAISPDVTKNHVDTREFPTPASYLSGTPRVRETEVHQLAMSAYFLSAEPPGFPCETATRLRLPHDASYGAWAPCLPPSLYLCWEAFLFLHRSTSAAHASMPLVILIEAIGDLSLIQYNTNTILL
jgi:hypothetical protein